MAIQLSSGFSHLRSGAFHIVLQTHKIQHTQQKKRRTNKHGLGLAPSARREKFVTLLCGFLWSTASEYPSDIPTQPPGTLTHLLTLADLDSESTGPSSSLSGRLSLTVAFPRLLLTAFFCWLPWDLASLIFFRSRRKSRVQALCVGYAPKRTKGSSDWHSPTPTETNDTYRATNCFHI